MKYVLALMIVALCANSTVVSAGEEATPTPIERKIAPLSNAKSLKLGFIGRGRAYPSELKTIHALAKDPQAEACFLKLAENKNSCAALYGLVGLKVIKSKKFDDVKATLVKRADKVKTTQGCYHTSHSVKQLADNVAKATIPKPPVKK